MPKNELSFDAETENKHFDVGLVGWWFASNYGSAMTYYGLGKILEDMNLSSIMIQIPKLNNTPWEPQVKKTMDFMGKYFSISNYRPVNRLKEYNDLCDTFMLGSDQLWTKSAIDLVGYTFFLDFAAQGKKKIAFATSFGHEKFKGTDEQKANASAILKTFDYISVRERSGIKASQENFGIEVQRDLDPVFICDVKHYDTLADKSSLNDEDYLLCYILDPTEEKQAAIKYAAEKLNLKIIALLDMKTEDRRKAEWHTGDLRLNPSIEDFIYYFKHCKFLITDSHHGVCFGIIYNKNFISIANYSRGVTRFTHLLDLFELSDKLIYEPNKIIGNENVFKEINYEKVNEILRSEKMISIERLKEALRAKPKNIPIPVIRNSAQKEMVISEMMKSMHIDVKRCQMVAALLRDYGIKHIVISSGNRHTELVRFFEYNDCFVTHNVVDERSAGFFALGLSTKLRMPVAVCCTSGTAASNYLTSMSEAFYQHVPLIYITADRYPYLLNQREDQMVPQVNMYGSVCLKSVTLIPKDEPNTTAAMRRMVCETILEATHNQPGPVHINIPIAVINERPLPLECYDLSKVYFFRIRRYRLLPDRSEWNSVLEKLKRSSIMIVYGQNHIPSPDVLRSFDEFARKFNCVFCTDNLSNYNGSKAVNSFNIIKPNRMTPEMLKELEPDIVITMYGSNVTPFRNFILKSKKVYHWDISPSGVAADPYKKLSRIFECSPVQFVKRLNYMAGNISGDDSYYRLWKKYERINDQIPEKYGQKYAVYQILNKMPENSLLHLANSNTVRFACSYGLKNGIEVFCNRGTNGIDGSASSFMGQAAVSDEPCYLLIGDLSFFYDMNSLWNKKLSGNIRIALFNNFSADLLKSRSCKAITFAHHDTAEGWVKSRGFTYLSARNMDEFNANIDRFVSDEDTPMFFEVFC